MKENRFIDNDDGTITDKSTGLMWQREAPVETMTRKTALEYTENLTLAGYGDWRLPNRNELESIVDYQRWSPAIDTAYFPNTVPSWYWSSSTFAGSSNLAWVVGFYSGNVNYYGKSGNLYVRAVRGGQKND